MMRLLMSAALGLSLVGWNLSQARADDEVTGPVPGRADSSDPASEVYRATAVIGMPVKNDEGEEIGHVKDLVINGSTREVLFAVLSMSGAEDREAVYIMPWNVFQPSYGRANALEYVILGVPQNVWIKAPTFHGTEWHAAPVTTWGPRVNTYFSKYVKEGRGSERHGKTNVRGVGATRRDADDAKDADAPKSDTNKTPKASAGKDAHAESDKPVAKKAATRESAPRPAVKAPPVTKDVPPVTPKKPEVKPEVKVPAAGPEKVPSPAPKLSKTPTPKDN